MTTKDSHTKTWVWVTAFPQGQTELFGWSPLGIQDRMIYGQDSSFSFFFFFKHMEDLQAAGCTQSCAKEH